jgi:hypothetical protein
VSDTLRVVRVSKTTRSCSSSWLTAWLTADRDTDSSRAAAAKLPCRATARNVWSREKAAVCIVHASLTGHAPLSLYSIEHGKQLEAHEALCDELRETPANVALSWLLHNPVVTAPIIGPRTPEQLTEALRAPDIALSSETLGRLDEIWPGPGGEAPKAYAW